ncbi:MAG: CpXC domain-containing protein [Lentihominibacter sp.]|jgi:predicted RNA-binding Zn-ribbon protein involved in translation (DUF1610 family)
MSMAYTEIITCPKCGKESEITLWKSINVSLDREMFDTVRNGEAFMFTCPHCGERTRMDYGFLYHQMEDMIMIYYTHEDEVETAYEIFCGNNSTSKMMEKMFDKKAGEKYLYRIVTSQNRLREKLVIFDEGLDDRIVEMMKLIYLGKIAEDNPDLKISELLLYKPGDNEMIFEALFESGDIGHIDFDMEMYDALADFYLPKWPEIRNDDIVIDFNWAIQITSEDN